MPDRNHRKSAQLGMPFGTACNKLRKNLLFALSQKCGMDTCFKCGAKIDSAEEMTIEHKKDWLDIDTALFWDVKNIAFSHAVCNRPGRINPGPKKTAVAGLYACSACKVPKPAADFRKKSSRWNGLSHQCRQCARALDTARILSSGV